jgi:hypothetical protein
MENAFLFSSRLLYLTVIVTFVINDREEKFILNVKFLAVRAPEQGQIKSTLLSADLILV